MTEEFPALGNVERYPSPAYAGMSYCDGIDGCSALVEHWAAHQRWHLGLEETLLNLATWIQRVSTGALDYQFVHRGDQPPYSPKGTDDRNASSTTDEPAREGEGVDPPAGGVGPRRDRGPSGNGGGPVTPEGV